jgi:hypothetical protein
VEQLMLPAADPVAEGARIAEAAGAASVPVRLAGGVGVALCCPSASSDPLRRSYADVDLAARSAQARQVRRLLVSLGYAADEEFNTLHGHRRLLFWDEGNGRQLDVFLDRVDLCHRIELEERLGFPGPTLPAADLLMMKLQVVETNEKDLLDIVALLVDQRFSEDESGINLEYISRLTSSDWGLWRTSTMVMERVEQFATDRELAQRDHVHRQLEILRRELDESPKSRAWKLRAKVGERVRWYNLPEEAH